MFWSWGLGFIGLGNWKCAMLNFGAVGLGFRGLGFFGFDSSTLRT